jgi:hypothetical protein
LLFITCRVVRLLDISDNVRRTGSDVETFALRCRNILTTVIIRLLRDLVI